MIQRKTNPTRGRRRRLFVHGLKAARAFARLARGRRSPPDDLRSARHFVILANETAIGSAIHALPVLEGLRRTRPEAEITLLAAGPLAVLATHNPFVDHIVALPNPRSALAAAARTVLTTRSLNDADVLVTTISGRQGRMALLGALTGIPFLVGHTTVPGLYAETAQADPGRPVIDNNLASLGRFLAPGLRPEPRVFFAAAEVDAAHRLLEHHGIADDKRPRVVMVTQTSGGQPSAWFANRFAEVADHFAGAGAHALFVGTRLEAGAIDGIRAQMRHPSVSLAGETDLLMLAALLGQSDLAVAVDTGAMHLGRAVGLPMVLVAPAWQPAIEWLPIDISRIRLLMHPDIHCRNCRLAVCPTGRECMALTTSGDVIAAAEQWLAAYPADPAARHQRMEMSIAPPRPAA